METGAADYRLSNSSRFGHSVHLTATNLNHVCRTNSFAVIFEYVNMFMFNIVYICFADVVKTFQLENFKLFFHGTSKIQALSSKLLSRSGIFFQVTSKIHTCLARDFSNVFQDTRKNNAWSCKILEIKSDRFLQKMYGSSTGELKVSQKRAICTLYPKICVVAATRD